MEYQRRLVVFKFMEDDNDKRLVLFQEIVCKVSKEKMDLCKLCLDILVIYYIFM